MSESPVPRMATCTPRLMRRSMAYVTKPMPFCEVRRPTMATSGRVGSTFRPSSSCKAALSSAFLSSVSSVNLVAMSSSVAGLNSSTSIPFRMPCMHQLRSRKMPSSPSPKNGVMSSWAYVGDTVEMVSEYRHAPFM